MQQPRNLPDRHDERPDAEGNEPHRHEKEDVQFHLPAPEKEAPMYPRRSMMSSRKRTTQRDV
jgi:hypothetical protein